MDQSPILVDMQPAMGVVAGGVVAPCLVGGYGDCLLDRAVKPGGVCDPLVVDDGVDSFEHRRSD